MAITEKFSEEKLREYEANMYKRCGRLKTKKAVSIVAPIIAFIIYIAAAYLFYYLLGIISAHHKQGEDIILFGFNMGQLDFPAVLIVFLVCHVVAQLASIVVTIILNVVLNIVNKPKITADVTDSNLAVRLKNLVETAEKYRNKNLGVFDIKVKGKSIINIVFLLGAVLLYAGFMVISKGNASNDVIFIILVAYLIIIYLPFLILCKIIDKINTGFAGKLDNEMYKILDIWWLEKDPEEKLRRERKNASGDSFISTMAKVYAREQSEKNNNLPEHGPYGTATNCGMPGGNGMPVHIDVSDM